VEPYLDTALHIAGWTAFGFAILIGLALDLVGLFGNWIILGAVGIAWAASGFAYFGVWPLCGLLLLSILGEALEMVFAGVGARKFGGSKGSVMAALIGCLLGAALGSPLFPLVGTLIGACIGAFAAAALYEYLMQEKTPGEALRTGFGAALGKVAGLFAKLFCGLLMLAIIALTF
jgi:uncharacterized protein